MQGLAATSARPDAQHQGAERHGGPLPSREAHPLGRGRDGQQVSSGGARRNTTRPDEAHRPAARARALWREGDRHLRRLPTDAYRATARVEGANHRRHAVELNAVGALSDVPTHREHAHPECSGCRSGHVRAAGFRRLAAAPWQRHGAARRAGQDHAADGPVAGDLRAGGRGHWQAVGVGVPRAAECRPKRPGAGGAADAARDRCAMASGCPNGRS